MIELNELSAREGNAAPKPSPTAADVLRVQHEFYALQLSEAKLRQSQGWRDVLCSPAMWARFLPYLFLGLVVVASLIGQQVVRDEVLAMNK